MKHALAQFVVNRHTEFDDPSAVRKSLHPIAGEIVGVRLMRKLGIGAPSEISLTKPLTGQWVVKTFQGGRLKFGEDGEATVFIRKIPGAIDLETFGARYGVRSKEIHGQIEGFTEEPKASVFWNLMSKSILHRLSQVKSPKEFFADFLLPNEESRQLAIIKAVQWDSPPMLAIHAARLFLGCSAAHVGNVLIDADATLYSIDHERCFELDGSELDALFKNVVPGTSAWLALAGVTPLDECDVADLFADPPSCVTWPLGSKDKTITYFQKRLAFWKQRFLEQSLGI